MRIVWLFVIFYFQQLVLFSFTREDQLDPKQRLPSLPYISGDAFRAYCDFVLDETNASLPIDQISENSAIFVGPYVLREFFEVYHPLIRVKYILVTHNTDSAYPGPYGEYLEDTKIIAWFSQNVEKVTHPKLFPIPIGIGNRYTFHKDVSTLDQLRRGNTSVERDILVLNRLEFSHPERKYVNNLFAGKSFVASPPTYLDYPHFLKTLKRSKFVLSPRGAGWDCHRTWEALYLGAIPIIKIFPGDSSRELFQDLPVLLINNWEEVTEEFLDRSYQEIRSKAYCLEKIYFDYWKSLMDYAKKHGKAPKKQGYS